MSHEKEMLERIDNSEHNEKLFEDLYEYVIHEEVNGGGRWCDYVFRIVKVEDRYFSYEYGRAKTEMQEDDYYSSELEEIKEFSVKERTVYDVSGLYIKEDKEIKIATFNTLKEYENYFK